MLKEFVRNTGSVGVLPDSAFLNVMHPSIVEMLKSEPVVAAAILEVSVGIQDTKSVRPVYDHVETLRENAWLKVFDQGLEDAKRNSGSE